MTHHSPHHSAGCTRASRTRGLSLIELVVAMAIFALVAVMGLQALTGMMRVQDRLVDIDDASRDLGYATALLRADMSAVVPMLFYPPVGSPQSALELSRDTWGLSMSLAGQPALGQTRGAGLQRAEWRFDATENTLTRSLWNTLYPVGVKSKYPDVTVLSGVKGWTWRSYWPGAGWVQGMRPPALGAAEPSPDPRAPPDGGDGDRAFGSAPQSYSSTLPLAIELRLNTEDHGTITLFETVQ